ncbi:hypothetical protein [Mesorhizobium sp.]|uniref:hypothetical protein n=1 Tax=Mesorhizobium sp. TaxID=1871066 RepID=UPI000FEA9981|nr:hypothetical protein [Mesorhizobium sp.]RWD44081.1 MAG: hypothetical protein EOS35_18180 [Mesorhizobium sp.]
MSRSYSGSVEVGPHWCQDILFESVADRCKLTDDLFDDLRKRAEVAAVAAQLMFANPSLDLLTLSEAERLAAAEAVAEEDRSDVLRSRERAGEIWAEILPATRQIMEKLHELPAEYWLWALAQVVGDAISQMSETKKDAIVRHRYLDDCTCQKIAEVFGRREREGTIRN